MNSLPLAPPLLKTGGFFVFQLNDLENKVSGGFVQTAAKVFAVSISGLASFQFFATYNSGMLAGIVPAAFMSIAAGLIGVTMLEGATLFWQNSIQNDADSEPQLAIAKTGYLVSLVTSVVITLLYFLLTFSLIAQYIAEVQHIVNGLAVVVLVGIIGFQFVAKTQYDSVATKAERSKNDAILRALQNKAEHTVKDASTRADLEAILSELQRALPDQSRQRGTEGARQFIRERYRVPFEQNGHK